MIKTPGAAVATSIIYMVTAEIEKLSSGSVLIPPSSHIYFCPPCRAMRNHYAPSMFFSSSPM
ncbi:MAG: hypothetical protein LBR22_04565, partial [Desulfovibrio sp.]|nr:hypothetical protein [Desulfovibrio sp.]